MCVRKPIVVTCSSSDKTVRIWNYLEKTLELCKKYAETPLSVCLHPSGLHLLVGFSDKLRYVCWRVDATVDGTVLYCACVHPSSVRSNVTEHKHRLMNVLIMDDLRTYKELPVKNCGEVRSFSFFLVGRCPLRVAYFPTISSLLSPISSPLSSPLLSSLLSPLPSPLSLLIGDRPSLSGPSH